MGDVLRIEVSSEVQLCFTDLDIFKTTLRSIGEFVENSQIDIDLNKVKKFASQETPDDLKSISDKLTLLRIRNLPDFQFTTTFITSVGENVIRRQTADFEAAPIREKIMTYDARKRQIDLETSLSCNFQLRCILCFGGSAWTTEEFHEIGTENISSRKIPETFEGEQVLTNLKFAFIF